ncbi:MAG: ATP-binding cassette domain-containing protein, partial [Candidatus Gastranaerophilales bacterium]|nr:ATP-binding cassette domain-containing protein [Candidatus Gastranaerophilales bacterium]
RHVEARARLQFVQGGADGRHRLVLAGEGHAQGGQNQRVAIARALANKPSVIFADEPTGALDQKTSDDIYKLFRNISQENKMTFVIVTHEANMAQKADRLIEIIDGKIIKDINNNANN